MHGLEGRDTQVGRNCRNCFWWKVRREVRTHSYDLIGTDSVNNEYAFPKQSSLSAAEHIKITKCISAFKLSEHTEPLDKQAAKKKNEGIDTDGRS